MNKQEYINELAGHLSGLPSAEVQEILADYREHFDVALGAGKSETEVAQALGSPRTVAQGYAVHSLVNEAHTSPSLITRIQILPKALLMFLVLAPFNFLVIIGPFLILLTLTILGWAVPIVLAGVSMAAVFAVATTTSDFTLSLFASLSLFFGFLGALGLAAMASMLMFLVSKFFSNLVLSYLRWNIHFISARRA